MNLFAETNMKYEQNFRIFLLPILLLPAVRLASKFWTLSFERFFK
jgi:hypothetical protein